MRGKPATNKDFALEVAKLSRGNQSQNIYGMTDAEIAKTLGFKHYTSIQGFKKLATTLGYFEDLDKPKVNRSSYVMQGATKEFVDKYESVQTWIKDMKKRARGGKAFGGTNAMVRKFKILCDTLEMHPDQFVTGSDRRQILEAGEDCIMTFTELYMQKKAKLRYGKKYGQEWNPKYVDQANVKYNYSQAMRNFMKSFGAIYPSGHGGATQQSVKQFHGKFADVRFRDWSMYQDMKDYIIKHYGLDTDLFRWFSIGVEALPRASAIQTMKNNFEPVTRGKNSFYVMEVIETKTSQINGGVWEKYIKDSDTKESIDLVKKRSDYVIENRATQFPNQEIYPQLREVYKVFELDKIKLKFPDIPTSGYFNRHTSHALRHCGAQLWLDATNWSVDFVASMGWDTVQELTASYGRMPAQMRLKVLDGAKF